MTFGDLSESASEMLEEEPVYVNAKQYNRIMLRRQARQKMEQQNRIPRARKVPSDFFAPGVCGANFGSTSRSAGVLARFTA